ncbi:hypothetical protein KA005_51690 [bacterium]|nr:hypothetical protein [bacterium]
MANTKKERGWAGHFCAAASCKYRRNTLITYPDGTGVVVSSVGSYFPPMGDRIDTIGYLRYYETMAFPAIIHNGYVEGETNKPLEFEQPWSICAKSPEELPDNVDMVMDGQHEDVVDYFFTLTVCPKPENEGEDNECI